jgi:hypothetical protein
VARPEHPDSKLIEEYRLEASSGTPFFLTTLLDEAPGRA